MTKGLSRSGFDIDLNDGIEREAALAHLLKYGKVEVKSDKICRQTGNIFIEYRQKGQPSGIAVTTADYWAIEYDDDCWLIIPTAKLKAITRLAYRDKKKRRSGGDFDNFDGILVPVQWLLRLVNVQKSEGELQ